MLPIHCFPISQCIIKMLTPRSDYRTYRQNKTYRPIYYHEFMANHEARKRYWARSFLGWTNLYKAKPNETHYAIKDLADMGIVRSVVTQNVDSFHSMSHPDLPTLELHGSLRALTCVTCHNDLSREAFQESLSRLNPAWAVFLAKAIESGALDTENPAERRARGIQTNPDGDVDLPGAPYSTFRYPGKSSFGATIPYLLLFQGLLLLIHKNVLELMRYCGVERSILPSLKG
jgi:NAD-dependent deacetylase sirtuin 4